MPIYHLYDYEKLLPYYQYGKKGTRYYYDLRNEPSRALAYKKVQRQARAIRASQSNEGRYRR
jgi:hypothetical protein